MAESRIADRWDSEYKNGRYEDEPPVEFVNTIIRELGEEGKNQVGLYVGCGNGRNYMPLVASGLHLSGVDISTEAIDQLKQKHPEVANRVYVGDIKNLTAARVFDYVVSIQVFQHGDEKTVGQYFQKTAMALRPGGRLFLRVNSDLTDIYHDHHVAESGAHGGSTIIYDSGPKKDLKIHFFSKSELEEIAEQHGFDISLPIYGMVEERHEPETGAWTQWEAIWVKR